MDDLFPETYEQSRTRFQNDLRLVQMYWPHARLRAHRLAGPDDVSIDWIQAAPLEVPQKLLLFTTGEHGIEGYLGSAMLRLFMKEYLCDLNPKDTGVLLVHAINPWGMKNHRRTNVSNVDLNRNFVTDPGELDAHFNPAYSGLEPLLNPDSPAGDSITDRITFTINLLWRLLALGPSQFRSAVLLGQYRSPQGVYYGGSTYQEETQVLMGLYRSSLIAYPQVVHLDMHTGYGPRQPMSIVTSGLEPRSSAELARTFGYPLVVKANAAEFYSIHGDMIDYVYHLATQELPSSGPTAPRRLFAASFEFGTFGSSLQAIIRSLRALLLENQSHWHGARDSAVLERIQAEFDDLFSPSWAVWREHVVANARQAFHGILAAEGFLEASRPAGSRGDALPGDYA